MRKADKPLVWLKGEIKTPPFSTPARIEAGVLLRDCNAGKVFRCLIRAQCPASEKHVMNCGYRTAPERGASFITSTLQRS